MRFSGSWFEDEVRDGFYISSLMKRNWAAQLQLLEDIADVCRKHQIKWYIWAGTLLGAVRHEGFIPWDDDIDIAMSREDFIRFQSVYKQEFPSTYCLIDSRVGNVFLTTRLANSPSPIVDDTTKIRFHGHPFQVQIDIFVLDAIPSNNQAEQTRHYLGKQCQTALAILTGINTSATESQLTAILNNIENLLDIKFNPSESLQAQLFDLFENLCQYTYADSSATEVSIFPYCLVGYNYRYNRKTITDSTMLTFEGHQFPAPADYDSVLKSYYNDYLKIVRTGECHEYPYYRPAELAQEKKPDSIFSYSHFASIDQTANEIRTQRLNQKKSPAEFTKTLKDYHYMLEKSLTENQHDLALQICQMCQTVAIELGTLLESTTNDSTELIGLLEEYCEQCYHLYTNVADII